MYHKYVTWCRSVAPTNHRGGRSSVRFQWQCSSPGERCWLVRSYHDGFHGPCALLHQHLSEVVWWPVKSETPRILIIAKLSNRNSPWFTMIHPANSPWLSGKIHEKSMACGLWSQTADGHTQHQGCQGQDLDASSRHRRESVTVVTVVTVPVAPHCHVGRKEWLRRQGERLTKSPKCRDIKNKLRWNKKEKLLKLLHGKSWHPIHRSNSGKTCVHGTSSVAHSLPQWPHGWNALAKSRAWRHAWQRMENNSLSSRSEVITVRGIRHWPFGTQMHKKKTTKRKRRRKKQRRRKHKKETGIRHKAKRNKHCVHCRSFQGLWKRWICTWRRLEIAAALL